MQEEQQQQQQVIQMQHMNMNHMMAAANYYPHNNSNNNNLTSHHIQQLLDENKSLILKIVESQSSGKLSECAENQARLQQNLMYLAAIADAQPQPTMHSQYAQGGMTHSGAHYLQTQQMTPQHLMAGRSSMLYSQQQYSALQQQQQTMQSHLGMSGLRMTGGGGSKQDVEDRVESSGGDNN